MSEELKVADNRVVQFHYTVKTDDGELINSSDGAAPVTYLHGASMILPGGGLIKRMSGCAVGEKFSAVVSPEEAYGEYQEPGPQPISRASFPAEAELEIGMSFPVEASTGEQFPVWITDVQEESVYVDSNHPLAGKSLHFDIEIVSIREATEDEAASGHPNVPSGPQTES